MTLSKLRYYNSLAARGLSFFFFFGGGGVNKVLIVFLNNLEKNLSSQLIFSPI